METKTLNFKQLNLGANNLIAVSRPTTEEDNYGQIYKRYDLYTKPHVRTLSTAVDIYEGKNTPYFCGKMVIYFNGDAATFHGSLRYDHHKGDFQIQDYEF